ncbi:MAG: universal stress protein [Haliea sp.]|uniref:universal stress protein n=1 Tax=Haliea sp. TaxID=1932666 RepID=UPI0032EC2896
MIVDAPRRRRTDLRVLALLDASRQSLAALRAATEFATQRRAELVALYVEDQDLLRSADFPFAREVGGHSGLARPLSPAEMQVTLAGQLQRARRALEAAVAGRDLAHSLQVSRGRVVNAALALADRGDLLVLGKAGLSAHCSGVRLGSNCRALILQAPCTVLILDENHPPRRGPLRVLSEPVPEDVQALPLCDRVEHLQLHDALSLERNLAGARSGALLLRQGELRQLAADDPNLLARIPVPVIVVPDPH